MDNSILEINVSQRARLVRMLDPWTCGSSNRSWNKIYSKLSIWNTGKARIVFSRARHQLKVAVGLVLEDNIRTNTSNSNTKETKVPIADHVTPMGEKHTVEMMGAAVILMDKVKDVIHMVWGEILMIKDQKGPDPQNEANLRRKTKSTKMTKEKSRAPSKHILDKNKVINNRKTKTIETIVTSLERVCKIIRASNNNSLLCTLVIQNLGVVLIIET